MQSTTLLAAYKEVMLREKLLRNMNFQPPIFDRYRVHNLAQDINVSVLFHSMCRGQKVEYLFYLTFYFFLVSERLADTILGISNVHF